LLDSANLWKSGIPTVAIVWRTFEKAARAHAALQGLPQLPLVVLDPLGSDETPDHQRSKAREAVQLVIDAWTDALSSAAR
jgi:hypothetical protein